MLSSPKLPSGRKAREKTVLNILLNRWFVGILVVRVVVRVVVGVVVGVVGYRQIDRERQMVV